MEYRQDERKPGEACSAAMGQAGCAKLSSHAHLFRCRKRHSPLQHTPKVCLKRGHFPRQQGPSIDFSCHSANASGELAIVASELEQHRLTSSDCDLDWVALSKSWIKAFQNLLLLVLLFCACVLHPQSAQANPTTEHNLAVYTLWKTRRHHKNVQPQAVNGTSCKTSLDGGGGAGGIPCWKNQGKILVRRQEKKLSQRQKDIEEAKFKSWISTFTLEALQKGIPKRTVDDALRGVRPFQPIVAQDRNKPEVKLSAEEYISRLVSPSRVVEGQRLLQEHGNLLVELEETYGVPPEVLMALWGIESSYGHNMGVWDAVQAILTLAYRSEQGWRRAFFREELFHLLRILSNLSHTAQNHGPQQHLSTKVATSRLKGSYAGALGQCQFMPSSFLEYAVDHDKDGFPDIWNSPPDILASMASYLKRNGWQRDQPIGWRVSLPKGLPDPFLGGQSYPVSTWVEKLGLLSINQGEDIQDTKTAGFMVAPDGPSGYTFLACQNFKVLLTYNRYPLYALAIAKLARSIHR